MQTQPVIFVAFMGIIILIGLFFIIKGIRTGKMFTRFQTWADRKEDPVTYWFYMIFDSLLVIILLAAVAFTVIHYLL
jgi:hypothetical protein